MFNPAQIIYNEVNEYIKNNGKTKEKDVKDNNSLMKRTSSMEVTSTKKKQPIEDIIDIVLQIRESNPKYKKEEKKQIGVTDIIDDEEKILVTPAGKAKTKQMKKELFKKMGVIQDA
jgi:hypothetical protein